MTVHALRPTVRTIGFILVATITLAPVAVARSAQTSATQTRSTRTSAAQTSATQTRAPSMPEPAVAAGAVSGIQISGAASAAAPAQPTGRTQAGPLPPAPSVDNPALAGCDAPLLQALTQRDPAVAQWIMVVVPTTTSTTGTLAIATVSNDAWRCTLAPTVARVGRQGIVALQQRRSGDGTTPAGTFPLGVVATPQGPISFFGNSADPGALGPYRRVQPGDCYGANPNTPGYGHWRVDTVGCTGDDELLANNVQTYEHAVLIGANTEPNVSGDAAGEIPYAAAIFLHRDAVTATGQTKPTSGCVSIGHDALVSAMRMINPALDPHFAIGLRSDLLVG